MKTNIVALFDNQTQAGQAIQALSASDVDFEDYRVLDANDESQTGTEGKVMPAMNPGNSLGAGGIAAMMPATADSMTALGLSDETARFYQQGLDDGGVVLVVEADDSAADDVYAIFDNFDGTVADR